MVRSMNPSPSVVIGLNAVIIAMTGDQPRVLTVTTAEDAPVEGGRQPPPDAEVRRSDGLPTGPLDPAGDRTLELALRRWVSTFTGVELGYVEQLYTFGDRFRDPRELDGGPRVVSAAYLALTRETEPDRRLAAHWRSVYSFFPWEDWRDGAPAAVNAVIGPAIHDWIDSARGPAESARRRERSAIAFGSGDERWDEERVLDRYELLYELGLVTESSRDGVMVDDSRRDPDAHDFVGQEMVSDHRRILATALGRIRAKIKYRPVVFELMPQSFTLLELQRTVEALAGCRLHKQNFRRLVERGGLVEGTGDVRRHTGGRPAALFRFRREVLLERPAPGVGLPASRIDG
jgi:hypothetical protein